MEVVVFRFLRSLAFALPLIVLQPVLGQAAPTGPLGEFNVLVFGDFTAPSSDVEGRLYAGGNVSLSSYSVGDKISGGMVGGDSLVVGGDLTFTSGSVQNGNIVVGGSGAGVASNVRWGTHNAGYTLTDNVGFGNLPVDFVAEQTRLVATSTALAQLAANGSSEYKWSQLFLTGDGTGNTQIFNIDASALGAATNIVVQNIADGVEVVINVSGSVASMSGGMDQFFERNRDTILFNFFEAETLSLANIGVQASILAPETDIQTSWGVVWGQVVGASWTGPMQVNQVYYDGYAPPPGGPVGDEVAIPAPGALGIVLIGLCAIRRLRRAA
ncbi:MAG: choice-of-anchor A family protein [Alphaproteobacteria bacterium]|nr:choice-of-anchor A family protein [Alphaproteobacteria bacterium]